MPREVLGAGVFPPVRFAVQDIRLFGRFPLRAAAASAPPVPSEGPLDDLPVQALAPEAVQNAEAPPLEVRERARERAVDPIKDFMRRVGSNRHRLAVLDPVAFGPAVRRDPRAPSGRSFDEPLQRRAGLILDLPKLDAPGLVPPRTPRPARRLSARRRHCAPSTSRGT